MFKDELKKFVQDNPRLVSMKPAGDGIYVLKYSRRVFYDNLWNDFLEECRGTIVDADFNLITYPFRKIYNFRVESKSPSLSDDTIVTAIEKINGFMVSLTWHNNDILVSTTGSTDSDYVNMARELMLKHMCWEDWQMALMSNDCQGMTFMFEACHKNDPHIVPEKEGLYILGYRINEWGSKVGHNISILQGLALQFNCSVPAHFETTIGDLVQKTKDCKIEGYVFYTKDGTSAKLKSSHYLTLKWVARNPRTDKLMQDDFKNQIDEEYYGLLAHIRENIESYTMLSEQDRLQFVRDFLSK